MISGVLRTVARRCGGATCTATHRIGGFLSTKRSCSSVSSNAKAEQSIVDLLHHVAVHPIEEGLGELGLLKRVKHDAASQTSFISI